MILKIIEKQFFSEIRFLVQLPQIRINPEILTLWSINWKVKYCKILDKFIVLLGSRRFNRFPHEHLRLTWLDNPTLRGVWVRNDIYGGSTRVASTRRRWRKAEENQWLTAPRDIPQDVSIGAGLANRAFLYYYFYYFYYFLLLSSKMSFVHFAQRNE